MKHFLENLLYFIILMLFFPQVSTGMGHKLNFNHGLQSALTSYGLPKESWLIKLFNQARVKYPPKEIALLAFKKERKIELWAKDEYSSWRYIHSYPLTAFSGRLGPKLIEKDGQIPEGIYRLITFNPFSSMHLSMMIDYPNQFDKFQAIKDGRKKLGSDIFLHGKSLSAGCLAVGDRVIDQLFLLVYRVGLMHTRLIIAPNDLRVDKPATPSFAQPRWLKELYQHITVALQPFSPLKKS